MTKPIETLLEVPLHVADAAVAVAGGGSPVDLDITVLINLVFFLVAWIALKGLLFDPYLKVREAREKGVGGSREEAEQLKAQAQSLFSQYEAGLAEARGKASEQRRALKVEGEAKERALSEAARAEAAQRLAKHRAQMEAQVSEARSKLREEAGKLSELMAQRLLPLG